MKGSNFEVQEIKDNKIQKLIKYSAYIALLNRLHSENRITDNEYEKIKKKIEKKS